VKAATASSEFILIGSLAHGGFSVRYSNIDMALIVEQPLSAAKLDSMRWTQRKAARGMT
jgi:hypothetical protein